MIQTLVNYGDTLLREFRGVSGTAGSFGDRGSFGDSILFTLALNPQILYSIVHGKIANYEDTLLSCDTFII